MLSCLKVRKSTVIFAPLVRVRVSRDTTLLRTIGGGLNLNKLINKRNNYWIKAVLWLFLGGRAGGINSVVVGGVVGVLSSVGLSLLSARALLSTRCLGIWLCWLWLAFIIISADPDWPGRGGNGGAPPLSPSVSVFVCESTEMLLVRIFIIKTRSNRNRCAILTVAILRKNKVISISLMFRVS